jgi:cytochrome c biogenesis protein
MTRIFSLIASTLASTKLALWLLALIAFFAILGTVLPQQETLEMIGHQHPTLVSSLELIGLFDIYHSVWFLTLEGLLALNLIACTWARLPAIWRRFRSGISERSVPLPEHTTTVVGTLDEVAAHWEETFKGSYGKPVRTVSPSGDGLVLSWKKYALSSLAVPVVHFGVLVILAGALGGVLFGFEGRTRIVEGESVGSVFLKGGVEKELNFEVRCTRFTVNFYDSGAPKEFRSDLEFIRSGRVVRQAVLRVNEPVTFDGIRFYQENYGSVPSEVVLGMAANNGPEKELRVAMQEPLRLPDGRAVVRIIRAEENLMGFGPGVKLAIEAQDRKTEFWVFKNIDAIKQDNPGLLEKVPLFDPGRFKPYRFALKRIEGKPYTGLLLSSDPAFPFVFGGFVIVVAGCCALYFFSPRKLALFLKPAPEGVRVGFICRYERNKAGEARETERIRGLLGQKKES